MKRYRNGLPKSFNAIKRRKSGKEIYRMPFRPSRINEWERDEMRVRERGKKNDMMLPLTTKWKAQHNGSHTVPVCTSVICANPFQALLNDRKLNASPVEIFNTVQTVSKSRSHIRQMGMQPMRYSQNELEHESLGLFFGNFFFLVPSSSSVNLF